MDNSLSNVIYHVDHTLPLKGWIFCYGSNYQGRHGKGAAKVAMQKFGAKYGIGEGHVGDSYGIPTVGNNLSKLTLDQIKPAIHRFVKYVKANPDLNFFLTRVGCQLAGHKDKEIAPLFKDLIGNLNVSFPINWKIIFEKEFNV